MRPFWSQPASLMVVSVRVCSRKALGLFNKSYGFVLQKLWSCTTKAMVLYYKRYGLVLQKIWSCTTKDMVLYYKTTFFGKTDKNEPVLRGQQPIAEQQREKRGTDPSQNWPIRNPLSNSFKKSDSQRGQCKDFSAGACRFP